MRKKCRHPENRWKRCGCAWYVTVHGVTHNLGADNREAARRERQLVRTGHAPPSGDDFQSVAERWLMGIEARKRAKTATNYRLAVEHASARIGHFPVALITAADIAEAEADMVRAHNFGPGTLRNTRQVILSVLAYARDARLTDEVPDMRRRYKIEGGSERACALEPDVMRRVLEHAAEDVRDCLRFGWLTGLRPAELVAVERRDVRGEVLEVRRQIVQATGKPGDLKTPASRRDVDLSPAALACVPDVDGRLWPVGYHTLLRRWHDALKDADLDRCGLHVLRHSNASLRLAAGQDINYVSGQLGHRGPDITLRVYSHLIPGPRQDPAGMDALAGV